MKILSIAAALYAALPLAPAAAAPLGGEEIRARAAGGEFRGYGNIRRLEDFIWRMRADGTVRSVSLLRTGGRDTGQFVEYGDAGTWRVEGNRLCVQFASVHAFLSGCYSVDGAGGDHVRLVGPANLEGTLGH
ncbi:MAG: hypothetical protein U1F37_07865 [Alphaproteobacteria bacterium]